MNDKKLFLLDSSKLYRDYTLETKNDCIRRLLAFKIIINCMSFEDLINNRQFSDIRDIRNIFLAHKQENNFFNAFNASELITGELVDNLINFMEENTIMENHTSPILDDERKNLVKNILKKYELDYYSGFTISNNFLCSQKGQIKEISSNPISSVFYRFNSSNELSILSNYFISNTIENIEYKTILINSKIDYILHSVNMCDSIFKDEYNSHSIDGLYEILNLEQIGSNQYLEVLKNDNDFWEIYRKLRNIRNKLSGHMDKLLDLEVLLNLLEEIDFNEVFKFVNTLDKAVYDTAFTHIAIKSHYVSYKSNGENINIKNIIEINGIENKPYF
jgi:hypothetical protein